MGLDIYHEKASYESHEEGDIYYQTEFEQNALSKSNIKQFIQLVPDTEVVHTVLFLNTVQDKEYEQSKRDSDGYPEENVTYLVGSVGENLDILNELEEKMKLTRDQAWFTSMKAVSPQEYQYKLAIYSKPIESLGLYFSEVGHQRKCMSDQFYTDYKNDHLYLDLKDFENLLQYVAQHECPDAYRNIQQYFIDNYEEGKSILSVSW